MEAKERLDDSKSSCVAQARRWGSDFHYVSIRVEDDGADLQADQVTYPYLETKRIGVLPDTSSHPHVTMATGYRLSFVTVTGTENAISYIDQRSCLRAP